MDSPSEVPSDRPRVRQFKPYSTPDSLDDLAGPYEGTVFLPHHLHWATSDGVTVDIGTLAGRQEAYSAAMEEGTVEDICRIVNLQHLLADWPHLFWSLALRQVWEDKFSRLRDIG